ncbi:endospore germination permease [Jeotgalibacillus sp. ET6]|uniref:GerAB/ArcD/ProY family transporter n=1 Tax=Jeotgalibacillus sp. ET6 TaxID=3037260 RepID=UPI002418302A|nr:endospore germination permease [Jeotgalibacillus sp. ET6]MDG5472122.1 endospore germination permease [Jeotgalibacillus sp. ET6]
MNTQITKRQLFMIVVVFIIFSSIIMAPAITVIAAKQDGWISMLLALIIGLMLNALYLFLLKKYNYPSLFELMNRAAGRWIGTLINLLIIFYALHLAALVLRNLSNFMIASVIPYSNPWVYQIPIIIIVMYSAVLGMKNLFLLNDLLFPIAIFLTLFSLILITKDFSFFELKPIFHSAPSEVFHGAYSTLGFPFIEVLIIGSFFQYVEKKEKLMRTYLSGIAAGGLLLVITVFIIIGNEGAYLASRQTYPTFSILRDIDFLIIFERVEILLAIAWLIGLFFKIGVCFLVVMMGLKHVSGSKTYRPYLIPIGILIWAMSNHLHKTVMDFGNFVTTSWTMYWFTLYCLVIVVLLIGLIRNKQKSFNS